jgi:K+ transporter
MPILEFGRVPIRLAWSSLVFPALVLNYAGQAAYVLASNFNADATHLRQRRVGQLLNHHHLN